MAATGPQQARHVFLRGCGLPAAWAERPQWRILEIGCGHATNFLAAWQAWRADPRRPRMLHHVAIEPAPVAADDIEAAAAADPLLASLAQELAARWRGLVPGFHRFSFDDGRVLLTLCVGAVGAMLREQSLRADCVLLTGFAAGPDPAGGSLDTVKGVTRLCRRGAALATASVSATLRAQLQACGWFIEQGEGATPQEGSLCAHYDPAWELKGWPAQEEAPAADAIVIGAGLAGAAAAASLARRGWSVRVFDVAAGPATGASDLPAGLLAPHQSPDDNPLSRLSRAGVRITLQEARARLAKDLEWAPTGVLEWRGTDARALPPLGEALAPWSREATDAQKRSARIAPAHTAWWHENAAWIEPAALVRSWLRERGVRFCGGRKVARLARVGERWTLLDAAGVVLGDAAVVVVAAAVESAVLLDGRVHLNPVRGQVTWAPHADDAGALPPFPVNGHGHFLPRVPLLERDCWITGSTYGRGDKDETLRREDDAANLQRLREVLPQAAAAAEAALQRREARSWSGVRCASSDRRPLVGELAPGLWVSTAMGSRGLTFAALCGELISARLHHEPLPLEARLAQTLDVARQRKGT